MFRPVTSVVSALSGCVANGHQTLHFVSSAPSEIPYGGFSPVRLQTRFTPRPPSPVGFHRLIGRHCRYLRPRRLVRSRACAQAAPRTSDHDRGSSGPWLPNRLYCPVGSLLTMATSAPRLTTQRLMDYPVRLRDQPARRRGSPIYPASPFSPCRCPYSGGPNDCARRCLHRWCGLRHFRPGSATTSPAFPNRVGRVTKRQHSLDAAAWRDCSPCFGQGFYDRACVGPVALTPHVGYDWMAHRHLPSPDFHRLDCQYYGLQTDFTDGRRTGTVGRKGRTSRWRQRRPDHPV